MLSIILLIYAAYGLYRFVPWFFRMLFEGLGAALSAPMSVKDYDR